MCTRKKDVERLSCGFEVICAKLQKSIVSAKEKGELFFFYQRKAVPLHPNHQKIRYATDTTYCNYWWGCRRILCGEVLNIEPSPAASICRQPGPRDMWWDNISENKRRGFPRLRAFYHFLKNFSPQKTCHIK